MGELIDEPNDIFLSEESLTSFQCYGESEELDSEENTISIEMKRYVSKITVSSINLRLPEVYNESNPYIYTAFLAQVYDSVRGRAILNNDGACENLDGYWDFLFCRMSVPLENNADNPVDIELYCYGENAKLVLYVELFGKASYYTVNISGLKPNAHVNYVLNVYQEGTASPLQELPEITIEAVQTGLTMEDYEENDNSLDLGQKPVYSGIGAAVLFDDGTLEITDITKRLQTYPFPQAVGVCVGDGVHSFVLNSKWLINSDYSTYVSLESDWTVADPNLDFSGYDNFEKMKSPFFDDLNQFPLANISNQNPARNGNFPYIPSVGELLLVCKYRDQINEYLSLLDYNSPTLLPSRFSYLSSTPHPDGSYYVVELSARGEILLHSSDETSFGLCFCVGNHTALKGCAYYIGNENRYNRSNLILPGYGNPTDDLSFVFGDGTHVVALSLGGWSGEAWSTSAFLVDGVFTTQDRETALSDFAGKENTEAIMYALNQGLAEFPWTSYYFYGGYLPSVGELVLFFEYWDKFAEFMKYFYSMDINNEGNFQYLWTSTQYSADKVWAYVENDFVPIDKASLDVYNAFECLPFEFSYD